MTAKAGKDFLLKMGDGGAGSVAAVKASAIIGDLTFAADTAGAEGNEFSVRFITGGTAGSESVHELDGAITIKIQSGVSTATQIKTAFDASDQAAELDCTITGTGSNVQVIGSLHQLSGGSDATSDEVFTTLGGLRNAQMTMNGEAIDVTNQGSAQYKELLDGAGIISMNVSGTGVFTNATNEQLVRTRFIARALFNMQISDGVNTYTAAFKCTKLERAGNYKDEQSYSMAFEASGLITIA